MFAEAYQVHSEVTLTILVIITVLGLWDYYRRESLYYARERARYAVEKLKRKQ